MRHLIIIILSVFCLQSCAVLQYQRDAISSYAQKVKEESDQKKAAKKQHQKYLSNAVAEGRLVKGMSKSQVKAVRGKPDYASTDKLMNMWRFVTVWTYLNTLDCVIFLDGKMDEVQKMTDVGPKKDRW